MKLSPFMKEYKASLKTMSKKRLINIVLQSTETIAQKEIDLDVLENRLDYLRKCLSDTEKEVERTEQHMKLVENALEYKEGVINKYKKLLETSVEHI